MRTLITLLAVLCLMPAVSAQVSRDWCHVYVVNVREAQKAFEDMLAGRLPASRIATAGQTVFPEFQPTLGEEELTTRHFPLDGGKYVITASVFYTDESMASRRTRDFIVDTSMLVGIAVGPKAQPSALSPETPNAAVAEVTHDTGTDKVRAKQYVTLGGQVYLVGIECDCAREEAQTAR